MSAGAKRLIDEGERGAEASLSSIDEWAGKIHCGDALETMRQMPSESVDLVLTSPPYNMRNTTGGGLLRGGGGFSKGRKIQDGYDDYEDNMPHAKYALWQRRCLREMMRLIAPTGAIFYNHKWRIQNGILNDRRDIVGDFPVRQVIIWRRSGGINFNRHYFLPTFEVIYMIAKKNFALSRGRTSIRMFGKLRRKKTWRGICARFRWNWRIVAFPAPMHKLCWILLWGRERRRLPRKNAGGNGWGWKNRQLIFGLQAIELREKGMTLSSKRKLLNFMLSRVGKVVESRQLQEAAGGAVEFGRRLRELRAEGWLIETHRDDARLKPGQWVLRSGAQGKAVSFARGISREVRARVLERNGYTCQMCGVGAGEIHPHDGRRVALHMGHIVDKSKGGSDDLSNLRALCSVCNEGAQNIQPMPPQSRELLVMLRRADINAQRTAYQWLRNKFSKND